MSLVTANELWDYLSPEAQKLWEMECCSFSFSKGMDNKVPTDKLELYNNITYTMRSYTNGRWGTVEVTPFTSDKSMVFVGEDYINRHGALCIGSKTALREYATLDTAVAMLLLE